MSTWQNMGYMQNIHSGQVRVVSPSDSRKECTYDYEEAVLDQIFDFKITAPSSYHKCGNGYTRARATLLLLKQ